MLIVHVNTCLTMVKFSLWTLLPNAVGGGADGGGGVFIFRMSSAALTCVLHNFGLYADVASVQFTTVRKKQRNVWLDGCHVTV